MMNGSSHRAQARRSFGALSLHKWGNSTDLADFRTSFWTSRWHGDSEVGPQGALGSLRAPAGSASIARGAICVSSSDGDRFFEVTGPISCSAAHRTRARVRPALAAGALLAWEHASMHKGAHEGRGETGP